MTLANDRLQQFHDFQHEDSTSRSSAKTGKGGSQSHRPTNVGTPERIVSLVGGGVLAALGLRRMSLGGLMVAGAGAMLMHRGYSGFCPLYKALDVDRTVRA